MRGIKEFSDLTNDNKHVYRPGKGFTPLGDARSGSGLEGDRSSREFPVIVTCSNERERLVAMTWFGDTARIWGNRQHPCMHTDPRFPDLEPGESSEVKGAILFFEGSLDEFADELPGLFKA